ncbi:Flp family type IVb pilin [Stenotrophomonas rhizophila]|jgi:pilus assembly protein Flp/PilA|uniref:Flp family type IVb pilin n=1 Tax=Stenotrophomonas rhizophila TaxID=216778 RepID=UPI0028B17845|nr:Flp family type IVb pilin [Stenotrophomonas rhizophila]MDY0955778.1 Flp family type IVb pilin [Stenotrophomonas rhizophila]
MKASIRTFLTEEDGVTALEYGILAAVIAGVLVVAARTGLNEMFTALFDKLKTLVDSAGGGTTPTPPTG